MDAIAFFVPVLLAFFVLGAVAVRRKRWVDRRTLSPFQRVPGDIEVDPRRALAGSTIVGRMNYSMGTRLTVGPDELCITGVLITEPLVARRHDVGRVIIRTRLGRRRVEFRDRDGRDSYVAFLTSDVAVAEQLSSLAWPVEDASGS